MSPDAEALLLRVLRDLAFGIGEVACSVDPTSCAPTGADTAMSTIGELENLLDAERKAKG